MSKKEFIIGLGGCGGRSVAAFRCALEARKEDREYLKQKNVQFEYLYIDSNDDVKESESNWSILGQNVALQPADFFHLKENSGNMTMAQLAERNEVKDWIGDITGQMNRRSAGGSTYSTTASATLGRSIGVGDEVSLMDLNGAGQMRRLGRALFALRSQTVANAMQNKINDLTADANRDVTFRIFCTCGGGTGSGSIVDMVYLIHSICQRSAINPKIIVYLYVASQAMAAHDAGSFYENEYCVIRDLNAMMVGKLSITPITGGVPVDITKLGTGINSIFLSSDLGSLPKLEQQIEAMAGACLDSIVYASGCFNVDSKALKSLTGEDLAQTNPGEQNKQGVLARSYKFSTAGVRRWRVPTSEIMLCLSQAAEARMWERILYGSLEGRDEREKSLARHIPDYNLPYKNTDIKKFLNDELAKLETELEKAYNAEKDSRKAESLKSLNSALETAIKKISELTEDKKYQKKVQASVEDTVKKVSKHLSEACDKAVEWREDDNDSVWGLYDLRDVLDEAAKGVANWTQFRIDDTVIGKVDALQENLAKREKQWDKIGIFTFATPFLKDKTERMLKAHYDDSLKLLRTEFTAIELAALKEFDTLAYDMVTEYRDGVDKLIALVERRKEEAESAVTNNEVSSNQNSNGDFFAFSVNDFEEVLNAVNKEYNELFEKLMADVSKVWKSYKISSTQYNDTMLDKFIDDIREPEKMLQKIVRQLHDRAIRNKHLESVLVGNIITRLASVAGQQNYWNARIGREAESFMSGLGSSAQLSPKNGLTIPQSSPVGAIMVGLPKNTANTKFAQWLEAKLRSSKPASVHVDDSAIDFYTHSAEEEIRVLFVPNWFPARFADTISTLYTNKYARTMGDPMRIWSIYFSNLEDRHMETYKPDAKDYADGFKEMPAVVLDAEVDHANELKTEVAKKLWVTLEGKKEALVIQESGQIKFTKIDDLGDTSLESYCEWELKHPSKEYKLALDKVFDMAVDPLGTGGEAYEPMTSEERMQVYNETRAAEKQYKAEADDKNLPPIKRRESKSNWQHTEQIRQCMVEVLNIREAKENIKQS